MKKLVTLLFLGVMTVGAFAQEVSFRQSQTRIIEPLQDVYVRPLVVDLEIIKTERQEYGPFADCVGVPVTELTFDALENAKKNAAYRAAIIDDADVIVAATFDVTNGEKGKGILITVRGYPAKYTNWRKVSGNGTDPETGKTINDYEWLEKGLFEGLRIRSITRNDDKTEALDTKK